MTTNENRPRLSIDLDQKTKDELTNLLPWGTQRLILIKVIQLAITFIKTNGLGIAMDSLLNNQARIVLTSQDSEEHF